MDSPIISDKKNQSCVCSRNTPTRSKIKYSVDEKQSTLENLQVIKPGKLPDLTSKRVELNINVNKFRSKFNIIGVVENFEIRASVSFPI